MIEFMASLSYRLRRLVVRAPLGVLVAISLALAPSVVSGAEEGERAQRETRDRSDLSKEDKRKLVSLLKAARLSYEESEFQKTADLMKRAHDILAEPEFLYRIALSYEKSDQPRDAVEYYRRYLEAKPDSGKKQKVEQTIAELELRIDDRSKRSADEPSSRDAPPTSSRTMPIVFTSIGGGLALGSIVFGVLYGQAQGEYRATMERSRSISRDQANLQQKVSRRNTLLGLTYGTTGLAVASLGYATYLWITGSSASERASHGFEIGPESATVECRPMITPRGIGLSARF